MLELIEEVLLFDDHRSSDKARAISMSTLIGANWKAQRQLLKDITKRTDVEPKYRRSSTLGTGFHMRAEQALASNPYVEAQEFYEERYVPEYDLYISGTFDLLYDSHLMDWKTSYGKEFPEDKRKLAQKQLSGYRWLNEKNFKIKDEAFILFVSQTVNEYNSYPELLSSIEDFDSYVNIKLSEIVSAKKIDCDIGVSYNPCMYCEYSKKDCLELQDKITRESAGSF